jgi:hypothetical protein
VVGAFQPSVAWSKGLVGVGFGNGLEVPFLRRSTVENIFLPLVGEPEAIIPFSLVARSVA